MEQHLVIYGVGKLVCSFFLGGGFLESVLQKIVSFFYVVIFFIIK